MTSPIFEVHYCPNRKHNVCVETTSDKDGAVSRRCLYEEDGCTACRYVPEKETEVQNEA